VRLPEGDRRPGSGSGGPAGAHAGQSAVIHGEPGTVDLTAAARYLLLLQDDQDLSLAAESAYFAGLDLWERLTGLEGQAALAYAHTVSTRATVAVLPPF
jgi:hypothetical protein